MSGAEAALLGAAIGAAATVGVAVVQARFQQRGEIERRRDVRESAVAQRREERASAAEQQRATLIRRYLFQLQDAVVSFDERLHNWREQAGEEFSERVDPGYFKNSTLYALARALGAERILVMEGVYPQIESVSPELGRALKNEGVDVALKDSLGQKLFHYHRLALAESAVQRETDGWRVITYTEFRRRCEDVDWALDGLLEIAYTALDSLKGDAPKFDALQTSLASIRDRLTKDSGIAPTV
jgi:hypothetical protein